MMIIIIIIIIFIIVIIIFDIFCRKEIKEGAKVVVEKIQKYLPLIACFNGKGIYEIYSGKKDFEVGRQPETIPGTETVSDTCFLLPPNE